MQVARKIQPSADPAQKHTGNDLFELRSPIQRLLVDGNSEGRTLVAGTFMNHFDPVTVARSIPALIFDDMLSDGLDHPARLDCGASAITSSDAPGPITRFAASDMPEWRLLMTA